MPIFKIQTPSGKTLEIEAENEAEAIAGAREWQISNHTPPKKSLVQEVTGAMANVNRGLLIGDEVAAGVGTLVNAAADGLAGRKGPDLGGRFLNELQRQRQTEDGFTQERPKAAALARGVGMAPTALVPVGGAARTAALAPRAANIGRAAVEAALPSYASGFADRGSVKERAGVANFTASAGGALGAGAGAFARATPKAAKPVSPARRLAREGVQLTPGQAMGGVGKRIEDSLTSVPLVGDAIKGAQRRGVETFNKAAVQRTLTPIGVTLPREVPAGYEAVAFADDALSAAYEDVLPRLRVRKDPDFDEGLRGLWNSAAQNLPGPQAKQLDAIIQAVNTRFGAAGEMDGQTMKMMESELSRLQREYGGSAVASERAFAGTVGDVRSNLRDLVTRSNPGEAQRLQAINQGYANLVRVQRAAGSLGAKEGVFSPANLKGAAKAGDSSVRDRKFSRGEALMQDLAVDAESVLPSSVPDSGTTGRAIVTGLAGLGATGGASMINPAAGAVVGAAILPYTKIGQAAVSKLMASGGKKPADMVEAIHELEKVAANDNGAAEWLSFLKRGVIPASAAGGAMASKAYAEEPGY